MDDGSLALINAEEACYINVIDAPYPDDGRLYCNATWDSLGCWNYTLAGQRAFIPCPAYQEGFDPSLTAFRQCNPDGYWWTVPRTNRTWSNYTTCVNIVDLNKSLQVIYLFVGGYAVSIIALAISLGIFFYFRQLKCDRVTLHKNLFTSYILNGVAWILYYTLAALDGNVLVENPVWCQFLHVVTQYLLSCNFFWMFCEGLYLHTIIVVAFASGKRLLIVCHVIGWCLPIVTTAIYTAIRVNNAVESSDCWLYHSFLQWIVFGPIVATIVMNLLFLCNIVRVLITKLRAVNSPDTNQTRKAVRATLILIPLLGLQYILFPLQPPKGTPAEEAYLLIIAFVTSFQGLFVAIIFCFGNGEVISVIKRKWGQHQLMKGRGSGRGTMYTHTTISMAENSNYPATSTAAADTTNNASGRLYENRCQAPGGKKPYKPLVASTNWKPVKLKRADYSENNSRPGADAAENNDLTSLNSDIDMESSKV